ncbi:MAG TPA: AAA family ATPase [Anaerolineae bacterium]|nr:AAA family ATPase [Anaerolineae bacterium]
MKKNNVKKLNFNFDENPEEKTLNFVQNSKGSIDALKSMLPGIPEAVKNLRKESENSLCGPCPKCGGNDRFVFRTDQQRFWCRQCNEKGGDIVDFHAWLADTNIKELFKRYMPGLKLVKTTYKKTNPFEHYELGSPIEKYPYVNANGKVLYYNCRFEPKTFRQCSADGLKWSTKGIKPKVPYNLLKVIDAETVFVFEGEKDCNNAGRLNFTGTCNVAGAGNWSEDLNQYFKNKKVILVPDNDKPGCEHIEKVFQNIKNIAKNIQLLELPGLSEGGDFSDWLDSFDDLDEAAERFSILIENAEIYEPPKKITINDIILSANEFYKIDVPEKQELLFPWLKEDSINLISGWRGCGKTWLALGILDAVSRGSNFGPWECKKSVSCLFLDGEMTIRDDRDRIENLKLHSARKNPLLFYSDAYANSMGLHRASLVDVDWRNLMKEILISRHVKLWVVDNIASLAPGLDENAKQDWDIINQWLLELRFCGISTILLHHVSKDGRQRGTSAREDNLDTSIMLKAPYNYVPEDGARFILQFGKNRVDTKCLHLLSDQEFKLTLDENKNHIWTYGNIKAETKTEILKLLDEGLSQTEITDILGIDKAYISRIRKKAIKDGLLSQKNKLTQSGFMTANG